MKSILQTSVQYSIFYTCIYFALGVLDLKYADLNTEDLINQLVKDEDRVTTEQINELIRRGEAAAPRLREILSDEYYWYEGKGGEHFIIVHAMIALTAMRDPQTLLLLIKFAEHAYFANHNYACDVLPIALAEYEESAIEPLITAITDLKKGYKDNPDYANVKHDFSTALTRIGVTHPDSHARISNFICGLFEDVNEDDAYFLSMSAAHPYILNKDRGIQALTVAKKRGVISEALIGKFDRYTTLLKVSDQSVFSDFMGELFDFYLPEAYQAREEDREHEKEEKLYWENEVISDKSVGRNDPCPCGSGKKYKKCCST